MSFLSLPPHHTSKFKEGTTRSGWNDFMPFGHCWERWNWRNRVGEWFAENQCLSPLLSVSSPKFLWVGLRIWGSLFWSHPCSKLSFWSFFAVHKDKGNNHRQIGHLMSGVVMKKLFSFLHTFWFILQAGIWWQHSCSELFHFVKQKNRKNSLLSYLKHMMWSSEHWK